MEGYEKEYRHLLSSGIAFSDTELLADAKVSALIELIEGCGSSEESFRASLVESLSRTIAARLLVPDPKRANSRAVPADQGLVAWRLKRVTDHIEAHLNRPLMLVELSAIAGLSRMHFAMQFRRTMGLSPHSYILRRRITRSQELLKDRDLRILDVAQLLGFHTQAHFTTVFKRHVGDTPGKWRDCLGLSRRDISLISRGQQDVRRSQLPY